MGATALVTGVTVVLTGAGAVAAVEIAVESAVETGAGATDDIVPEVRRLVAP